MRPRQTQFGVRGDTASPRQHGSRVAVSSSLAESIRKFQMPRDERETSLSPPRQAGLLDLPLTDALDETTNEKDREGRQFLTVDEVAVRLCVSRNWVYSHASELGVYRLGKYLRFSWSRVLERLEK